MDDPTMTFPEFLHDFLERIHPSEQRNFQNLLDSLMHDLGHLQHPFRIWRSTEEAPYFELVQQTEHEWHILFDGASREMMVRDAAQEMLKGIQVISVPGDTPISGLLDEIEKVLDRLEDRLD